MGVKKIILDIRSQLDKAIKDMKKLGTESGKAEKKVSTLNSTIKKAAVAFGAFFAISKVVQWGKAIGKVIADFQQNMAELSAITGAVGADLDFMKDKAIELSVQLKKTASEIVKAFQLVGSAKPELLKNAAALAEVTKQAIILAQAAGIDVPEAAQILTKALNMWGMGAKDAAKFTDILADSQKKGAALIRELGASLQNAGSIAAAVGMSFEDTNTILQAFAKGGLDGLKAGMAFQIVIRKLAQSAEKEFNPQYTRMNDILQTLKERGYDNIIKAGKLVGEEGARYLLTLIQQRDVVVQLTDNLGDLGVAMEQATINTDTLRGHQNELAASWEAFVLTIDDGSGVIGTAWDRMLMIASELLQFLTPESKILDSEMQKRWDTHVEQVGKTGMETKELVKTLKILQEELKGLKTEFVAINVADKEALKITAALIRAKQAQINIITSLLRVQKFKIPGEEKEEEVGVVPWMIFGGEPEDVESRMEKAFEAISGAKETFDEKMSKFSAKLRQKGKEEREKDAQDQIFLEQTLADNKLNILANLFGASASLFEQNSVAYKAAKIAQALIDTYASGVAAYLSVVGIPVIGPALAKAAKTNAIISGLASVAMIAAFEKGGFTGRANLPFVDTRGKRIAGVVHENEFVFSEPKTRALRPFFEDIHNDRINIRQLSALTRGGSIQNMVNAQIDQGTLERLVKDVLYEMRDKETVDIPYKNGIMRKRGSVTTILK